MDNSQLLTDGVLRVVAGLPGDYNGDLVVDAADFTAWWDSFGAAGADLLAEGNADLHVDEADYVLWRSNFGASMSASALASDFVPELRLSSYWAPQSASCG